eukprot:UN2677
MGVKWAARINARWPRNALVNAMARYCKVVHAAVSQLRLGIEALGRDHKQLGWVASVFDSYVGLWSEVRPGDEAGQLLFGAIDERPIVDDGHGGLILVVREVAEDGRATRRQHLVVDPAQHLDHELVREVIDEPRRVHQVEFVAADLAVESQWSAHRAHDISKQRRQRAAQRSLQLLLEVGATRPDMLNRVLLAVQEKDMLVFE